MPSFFHNQAARSARCEKKDRIVKELIEGVAIPSPRSFHAILMPGLYGIELSILADRGVPQENIWAIERDWEVHSDLGRIHPRLNRTPNPCPAIKAIDYVEALAGCKFNLVYFDFYGVPDPSLYHLLHKLFAMQMLTVPSTLIVTCGKTRCPLLHKRINDIVCGKTQLPIATPVYVNAALCGGYSPKESELYRYDSSEGVNRRIEYVTTVVKF